jgi:ElaB/YqjD/DUF883 family membrane-anchored ribosome-binding protein
MGIEETVFEPPPPRVPPGSASSGVSTDQTFDNEASVLQRGIQLLDELGLGDLDPEEVLEQAREAAAAATDYIRENPVRALALAAAAGALAGWFAGRR